MKAERLEVGGDVSLLVQRPEGEGTPTLVLHGFAGSASAMAPLTDVLVPRRPLLLVDLIGHGGSDAPVDLVHYSMTSVVRQLVAVLDFCEIERVDVVGYSMGARTALSLLAAHPGRVRRLAGIGMTPGIESASERAVRRAADEALAARIERDGIEAFVDEWEALPIFATQQYMPRQSQQRVRAGRLAQRPVGLANSLRAMGTGAMEPTWSALPGLTTPLLAIVGGADRKYVDIADRIASCAPAAQVRVIEGVGHATHLEAPVETATALGTFLTES